MNKKRKKDPFVYRYESFSGTRHKNDVAWWEAPIPRRWHWCRVQTTGWVGQNSYVRLDFCACGGIRKHGYLGKWRQKNSRRRWRK